MDTKAYKTKSEIIERDMPSIEILGNNQYKSTTVIALDGGYSAVKGVSPKRIFTIPSYAKKAPSNLETIGKVRDTDIQFRNNETGEIWLVGQAAETLMDQADIDSTTDASLYTRYRYNSETFKVIMLTGMALGLWGTNPNNKVFLQTGLPATYKDRDEGNLIKALSGNYDISIKVGNNNWETFTFTLDKDSIGVMEQPYGTLMNVSYDHDNNITDIGKKVFNPKSKASAIVLDIGFYTEDIFAAKAGYKANHNTYSDTAMRSVLEGTIKELQEQNSNIEIKIFELQKYLESGKVPCFDPEEFKSSFIEFGDMLGDVNKELCEKSIKRLVNEYDHLKDYQLLIVTGGTGESRYEQIKDMLKGFAGLEVIPGNITETDLSFSYSNVLGYYKLRRAQKLREQQKKSAE